MKLLPSIPSYFRVLRYVRPYWRNLAFSIGCTILYSAFSGMSIYLFIPLLSMLFNPEQAMQQSGLPSANGLAMPAGITGFFQQIKESALAMIFTGTRMDALLKICLIIFAVFLFKNLFGYLQTFFMSYVEESVIRDLRDDLYRHLHDLPLGYFTNERTGDLISRITNDVALINGGISAVFVTLIREPLLILIFLSLSIALSWKLTLISLLVFPFALAIIGLIAVRLHRERGISQESLADITSVLQETISGVKVVKAFGMEDFETTKFKRFTRHYFESLLRIIRMRELSSPTTEILSVLAGAFIIWYGGRQVLVEGTLHASEFLGFLLLIFQIMPPVKELTNVNNRIQEASAASNRIFEILDTDPSIRNAPGASPMPEFASTIEFQQVSFGYATSTPVLRNVSVRIAKGEIIAIVGPSGSGKTTFVDLIPRFYDPTSGKILIDGRDLRSIDLKSLRAQIGIVTQETVLFNDTVRNNIAYGLENCPIEDIMAAARAANAHDFIMNMSAGYETTIGERGVKLSGGERQRLSLARAILKNPPILILDEATSALDTESELLVQEAIDHLMEGRTSIVIAHRLSTVQHANRIIALNDGCVAEVGRHEDLLTNPDGVYRRLYEMQFRN